MRLCKALLFFGLFILVSCIPNHVHATEVDTLNYSLHILKNDEGSVNLGKVLSGKLDQNFVNIKSNENLLENKVVWLKLEISNSTDYVNWVIEFDSSIPYVTAYDNGKVKSTGAFVAYPKKDVTSEGNVLSLIFKGETAKKIYLRLEQGDELIKYPVVKFSTYDDWNASYLESHSILNLKLGLFLGVSLLVSIAMLFFFLSYGDRTYLYYGLYLLFGSIAAIGSLGYYWHIIGNIPQFFWLIHSLILTGFYVTFYQFIRHYFDLKKNYPIWNRVFVAINIQFFVFLILRIFFANFATVRAIMVFSVALITIVFFVQLLFKKNPIVIYIFWGSLVFVVSLIAAIGFYTFGIKILDFDSLLMLGIIGQIILFSLGLAYRMRLLLNESQEAKDSYIVQLKENQRIQRETNEQLEKKVKLRTKEIFQQKEEIRRKVEELAEVNKEVQLINDNLEQEVQKRTEKIKNQNKKLIDYAFTNAHHIRGPLARILGLLYLINKDTNTQQMHEIYIDKLSASANELDTSIKNAAKLLDDDISLEDD